MVEPWDPTAVGVVRLPSGRLVRGRGLRHPLPGAANRNATDGPAPTFGVYLLGQPPQPVPWNTRWVRWPDFWLPSDRADLRAALVEAWERAVDGRVELACGGGRGRTGTALACLAILDGVPPAEAIGYVRQHYHRKAVEMPWQHRFVRHFTAL